MLCPRCQHRRMGRHDRICSACYAAEVFGMESASRPVRTAVLCQCEGKDPVCPLCVGGEVEVKVAPF